MSHYTPALEEAAWTIWELYRACGDDEYVSHDEPTTFSRNNFAEWVFKLSRLFVYLSQMAPESKATILEAFRVLRDTEADADQACWLIQEVLEAITEPTIQRKASPGRE